MTTYGRIATIFYGLFGIPMMLLFLANIGSLMADIFRMVYRNLCCCLKTNDKVIDNKNSIPTSTPTASTSTTLRQIPGRSNCIKNGSALHELVRKTTNPLPGVSESLFITLAGTHSVFSRALQARKESRSVQVPVWLILFMFLLYLIIGAVVFAYWEGWGYLDAMYFVFVTVSTIGFGDLLPGMDDPNPVHRTNKLIAAACYLLLGLAMVAMCFDLMQIEVKRRSKRLARRIGLISSV